MRTTVLVRGPLAERLQLIADEEDLTLDELIDFILRLYLEGLLEEDDDEDE